MRSNLRSDLAMDRRWSRNFQKISVIRPIWNQPNESGFPDGCQPPRYASSAVLGHGSNVGIINARFRPCFLSLFCLHGLPLHHSCIQLALSFVLGPTRAPAF